MDKTQKNISILEHIVKYCNEIPGMHKYFGDNYEDFKTGGPYFKSIAMNLLQIGELANHLSKDFMEKHPQIPYTGIISLRNIIAHGYGTLPTLAALTLCLLCAVAIAAGCGKVEPSSVVKSSFIDARDGKEYRAVKIGEQVWMAENLNFVTDSSWCYGDGGDSHGDDGDSDADCAKYGRLYNWDAAMKACPAGWRLPTREDWINLVRVAGSYRKAGGKLKSNTHWDGTNNYGFSAMAGGYRSYRDSSFLRIKKEGYWWSATESTVLNPGNSAWSTYISGEAVEYPYNKKCGFSVRCLLD